MQLCRVLFVVLLMTGMMACGLSASVIQPPADAPRRLQVATEDLADILSKVTGQSWTVGGENPSIVVTIDPALQAGEIRIAGDGKTLTLAGHDALAACDAIYSFLHEEVGVRFWSPGIETIPQNKAFTLPTVDRKYVSPYAYREIMWNGSEETLWTLRQHLNGSSSYATAGDESLPPPVNVLARVHSFNGYVGDSEFNAHPEWFAEVDGKRTNVQSQLCLSNPDLRAFFLANVLRDLQAHPDANAVWVSQNDWFGYCTCVDCKAVDDEEGSPAGSIIRFVNHIADAVHASHPQVQVWTLAYEYSQKPPAITKPRDNVAVWLCSTQVDRFHSMDGPTNTEFYRRLIEWRKVAGHVNVWDYAVNFSHYQMPMPNITQMAGNLRIFSEIGITGIRMQGAWDARHAELSELRSWVCARLLWDPSQDAGALIDEFVTGYYGKAADDVRDYLRLLEQLAVNAEPARELGLQPIDPFLTPAFIFDALDALEAATRKAGDDATLLKRIDRIRLGLLYVSLLRWDELWYDARGANRRWPLPATYDEAYSLFNQIASENDVTRFGEGGVRDSLPLIGQRAGRPVARKPQEVERIPTGRWGDLQDGQFSPALRASVTDEYASDRHAIVLPSDGTRIEAETWRVPFISFNSKHKIKLHLVARIELDGKVKPGVPLFEWGITDGATQTQILQQLVESSRTAGRQYITYTLDPQSIPGWGLIWIRQSPEAPVKRILVDRIWMTIEE